MSEKSLLRRLGTQLWPDVSTVKGAEYATRTEAVALVWIAAWYLFDAALMLTTGKSIFAGKPFADTFELYFQFATEGTIGAALALIAWRLWKRNSLTLAWIGIVWITFEVVMKLIMVSNGNIVLSLIFLLFAINGVRGARSLRAAPPGL